MARRAITSFLTHSAPPATGDGGPATLEQALDVRVREGDLIERLDGGAVRCFACGHRCLVKPGRRGICKVRFNKEGTLLVPAGYVAALQCDPTEKKPSSTAFRAATRSRSGCWGATSTAAIARTG